MLLIRDGFQSVIVWKLDFHGQAVCAEKYFFFPVTLAPLRF